jgi:hypothetical protein
MWWHWQKNIFCYYTYSRARGVAVVEAGSIPKEYQEYFLEVKAAGA